MKNNLIMKSLTLILFSIATQVGCAAWGDKLYEEGQVLQTDDKPCFSIAENKETQKKTPIMGYVSVYELLSTGAEKEIWNLDFGGLGTHPTKISPKSCVTYGATPSESTTTIKPSLLEIGKRYEMYIRSDMMDDRVSKRREYNANFCLTQDETTQKITVHQVYYDEKIGMRRWDVCGIPNSR